MYHSQQLSRCQITDRYGANIEKLREVNPLSRVFYLEGIYISIPFIFSGVTSSENRAEESGVKYGVYGLYFIMGYVMMGASRVTLRVS